jgi:leucyl/phenylalanyl-tRNA--protein transferase
MTTGMTPEDLLNLYANGVFPMADSADDPSINIVDPHHRAIFPLEDYQVSSRLARTVRQGRFDVRINSDFMGALDHCAGSGDAYRPETWINSEIRALYGVLHQHGFAHSVECWFEDRMVGGLYGVCLGGAFFGESMFSHARDASKVALVHLIGRLKAGGYSLLDCQFMTEHLRSLGAIEITRAQYHKRLKVALPKEADFYRLAVGGEAAGLAALQAISQTS